MLKMVKSLATGLVSEVLRDIIYALEPDSLGADTGRRLQAPAVNASFPFSLTRAYVYTCMYIYTYNTEPAKPLVGSFSNTETIVTAVFPLFFLFSPLLSSLLSFHLFFVFPSFLLALIRSFVCSLVRSLIISFFPSFVFFFLVLFPFYLHIDMSINQSINQSINLSIYLSIYLSI